MKTNFLKSSMKAGFVLVTLGFAGSAWADCLDPSPVTTPSGDLLDADNYWYTLAGGKVTGCPENVPLLCEIDGGDGSCNFVVDNPYPNTNPDGGPISVTITSSTATGAASWSTECRDEISGELVSCAGVALIDAAVTDNASGGNACVYSFDLDAASATAGDPGHIRSLFLCSDGDYEPVPAPVSEPAVVSGCYLGSGETQNIHGVQVSCPTVPLGEQRTIFVAKDTETVNGELFVPEGFGFTNAEGIIDFNNICICVGGSTDEILQLECNPNPSFFTDPSLEGLPECTVGEGAQPHAAITIQNPRCVTIGGTRRCY